MPGPLRGAQSNPTPGMSGGTPGGRAPSFSGLANMAVGEVGYLWALVIIEVLLMGYLRKQFRRHHGG